MLLTGLAGCSISGNVERNLEHELPGLLGPADRYDVEIEGLKAKTGQADHIIVIGERVGLENAPVVDQLRLDLWGVTYNRQRERLEQVDSTRATAYFTPDDIEHFLEVNRNVQEVSITLKEPDRAIVHVRPDFGGIAFAEGLIVKGSGQLVGRGKYINFELSDASAGGMNLGQRITRRLSIAINPLVDLSESAADLSIVDLRIEDGLLKLDATGDPTIVSLKRANGTHMDR